MKSALRQDETLVKEGKANLQKGIEAVGGALYLTSQRLVFEAHAINVQGGVTELELADVRSVTPCWTRVLGFIPLAPNSISVELEGGQEHRFVVFGRSKWVSEIRSRIT